VLDLLCEHKTTEDIAATLVLSPETVRSHIKNILRKLNVRSRQEAILAAQEMRRAV
jgi:NarL family two-component system response regulator LiaR